MNRLFACLSVVLVAGGFAAAQTPSSGADASASPAAVLPGVTTTADSDVAQFQKIEDAWSNAVNQHDQYGLELVLSPLFVDISAQGDVTTRDQQVAQTITDQDKSFYLTQKVIAVRMLGDTAVANGTYMLRHRANGAEVEERGVFTHVFERVHGNWLCINSQRTVLPQEANSKQKKPSTTESPFHIPFFSKSDKGPQ